jgi:L-malate glycosyltransferase
VKKILYIHQDGKHTGSAISLSYLIRHLDKSQYTPHVLMAEEGPARLLFEGAGAKVSILGFPRFWTNPGPRWFARAAWRQLLFFFLPQKTPLIDWVKNLAPSLVHINDKAASPAGWALRRAGIPMVQHLRSSYYSTNSSLHRRLSAWMIRRYADAFIAISEDEVDGFETMPHEVIFNSIDIEKASKARTRRAETRERHGVVEHDFLAGYLSVVAPVRGIWNFLDVAGRLRGSEGIKFMVVGALPTDGFLKSQLAKKVEDLGLDERLVFTGFQQDSLAHLAAFDVLIVCNEQGVLGRPPFEAMAAGTPTAAFAGHSGRSRVLADGLTSKIVPRGDVAALAEAVLSLAENPDALKSLREQSLAYAQENFSPEKNAQRVMAVYQDLLQKRPLKA